jgi:hypothetical protein
MIRMQVRLTAGKYPLRFSLRFLWLKSETIDHKERKEHKEVVAWLMIGPLATSTSTPA